MDILRTAEKLRLATPFGTTNHYFELDVVCAAFLLCFWDVEKLPELGCHGHPYIRLDRDFQRQMDILRTAEKLRLATPFGPTNHYFEFAVVCAAFLLCFRDVEKLSELGWHGHPYIRVDRDFERLANLCLWLPGV